MSPRDSTTGPFVAAEASSDPGQELLAWRRRFPILESTTHLINHSLGAMPDEVGVELEAFRTAWAERGVRAWEEGWWETSVSAGDLLAPILGVTPGSVAMHQNVTVATAVFLSCLDYPSTRDRIVVTELEFPSVRYVLEGERRKGAVIDVIASPDGIGVCTETLLEAIDERTRLVVISHALFKSAWLQDVEAVARRCRAHGALCLLDVYQTAGAVPIELEHWGIDAAVGGSVKWLCGGPGAGYLWVDPELAPTLEPALAGWQADREPFAFHSGPIRYADSPWRFLTGTPNVPALYACRPGYRILTEVGVERVRQRSLALTDRLIEAALERGFEVRTAREHKRRGGTVTIAHAEAERLATELNQRDILCDFRPGAGIRLSPHFYNTEEECDLAITTMAELAG